MLRTYTSKLVDPLNVKKEDISIIDIAQSLAKTCRYNGHCDGFYSVAQHSVLMSNLYRDDIPLAKLALLHDAAEAYTGDIITPLKRKLKGIDKIEANILDIILKKFRVSVTRKREYQIKIADARMLVTEMDQLCKGKSPLEGYEEYHPYIITIECWEWREANRKFIERVLELWEG